MVNKYIMVNSDNSRKKWKKKMEIENGKVEIGVEVSQALSGDI